MTTSHLESEKNFMAQNTQLKVAAEKLAKVAGVAVPASLARCIKDSGFDCVGAYNDYSLRIISAVACSMSSKAKFLSMAESCGFVVERNLPNPSWVEGLRVPSQCN